ncbi:hypothetical protein [Ralstonia pseudosolanacearum]|uniref:hypothetical protein n=1 Tax=Ralstonia pseudosolanacearum TaxID=1310165 RepID=UPI000FD7E790|nr:hypothetical protein [Ralstonia pseudosolanacearum]
MSQITTETPRRILITESSQIPTLAESEDLEPNVTVIDRRGKEGAEDANKPCLALPAQDMTSALLAQVLETQQAMLVTLKAIEAKLSAASW